MKRLPALVAAVLLVACGGRSASERTLSDPRPSAVIQPATTLPLDSDSIPLTGDRYLDPVFDAVEVSTATFADDLADLVDGHPTSLQLDIYQPDGDTAARRPVIVWIHGGGFTGGSRSSEAEIATAYARLGYVTASVDYRTDPDNRCGAVRDQTIADPGLLDTETERCKRALQAAQDDVALAIAWLRSHAPDYRIDPTRIAVGGFSAGAVTAVNLAQRQNTTGPAPAVSAVSMALAASGCNFDPESIDGTDAPISILAAGGDQLVPYTCSVDTLDRAEAAGVMVQRLLYPNANAHAYGLYVQHQADVDTAWRDFLIVNFDLD
jgi:acetyl esterase/lipase